MNHTLVITAAGHSSRMAISGKKEYLALCENDNGLVSVLSSSLHAFLETKLFSFIIITLPTDGEKTAIEVLSKDTRIKPLLDKTGCQLFFTEGGGTRQDSVRLGLEALNKRTCTGPSLPATVLIHDAARPWVTGQLIHDVLSTTLEHGAAIPAIPAVDTQKEVDKDGRILRHLNRSKIFSVQTPQGFLFSELLEAHRKALKEGMQCTDDAEIWGQYVGDVFTCRGNRSNRKITFQEDII